MPTTNFVDKITVIEADWLNDVDNHVFDQSTGLHTAANITNVPAGNITSTSVQAAINELDSTRLGSFKNKIIGGDFTTNPWQRGTTFTSSPLDAFSADRFYHSFVGAMVVDHLKTADAPTAAQAGHYATHCLHVDVTTADASIAVGDFYVLRHKIEGYNAASFGFGQAGTRYITLSFWVKSTKTGTYSVAFRNSATSRNYVAEYSVNVTDTWEKKIITIPVDTTGTWVYNSGIGLEILWCLAAGENYQVVPGVGWGASSHFATSNQVNAMDSTSNNFKLALVQLEAGSVATPFEARDVGMELALCQRYYEKSYNMSNAPGVPTGGVGEYLVDPTTGGNFSFPFKVRKRAVPTVTGYSPAGNAGKYLDVTSVAEFDITIGGSSETGALAQLASHGAADEQVQWHWTASAEL